MVQLLCFFDGLGRLRVVVRAVRAPPSLADAAGLELGALVLPSYAGIARVAEQLHAPRPGYGAVWVGSWFGHRHSSSRRRRLGARGLSAALVCRNSTGCGALLRRGPGMEQFGLGRGSGVRAPPSLADAAGLELGALVLPRMRE